MAQQYAVATDIMEGLGVALDAIGNREWGAGVDKGYPTWLYSKWLAALLITVGMGIAHHQPLWAWAVIYGAVVAFRVWDTAVFFATYEKNKWEAAFKRAAWVCVLGATMSYLNHSFWPYAKAFAATWAIPAIYCESARFAAWANARKFAMLKGYQLDGTAIAEIIVGSVLGFISL